MPTLATLLVSLALLTPRQDAAAETTRRDPLPPLSGFGARVPEGGWKVIRPRAGDSISLKEPTRDFTIEDTLVQASPRTAFIAYEHAGPFERVTFRNSVLRVDPGTIELDRSYWAVRGYDMVDTVFENVEITNFGVITPKHDEGHAIYMNVRGPVTLRNCYIHHNGGQGLQLVNRPNESSFPPGPAEGRILIENTVFLENGFNPNRAAFQISIFGTGQEIVMRDVILAAGFDESLRIDGKTNAALLIEAEYYNPARPQRLVWWRPAELPEGFETPFTQGRTELTRLRVYHVNPNRPLVQIKGCEELIVRDCDFGQGKIELDHPKKAGRPSGRIVWEGNRGPAQVFHRGEYLGPASRDFVVEAAD